MTATGDRPESTPRSPDPPLLADSFRGDESRIAWATALVRLEIALWDRIDGQLRAAHEIPLQFFESLAFVGHADGGHLRVGDLAASLRITVGGTSKIVDRMAAAGLVRREPDPTDRRASRVTLTDAGQQQLAAASKTYDATVASLVDPVLEPHEQRQMHDYITRLLASLPNTESTS